MSIFGRKEIAELKTQVADLKEKLSRSESQLDYLQNILFSDIGEYISSVYEGSKSTLRFGPIYYQYLTFGEPKKIVPEEIEEVLKEIDLSFSEKLFELIREKKLSEVEVYKKADIDRRHFAKIRATSDYRPKKDTVILLCLSMRLSLAESQDLLKRAGMALSRSCQQDIIAEYFLKKEIYDVCLYQEMLYKYGFLQ